MSQDHQDPPDPATTAAITHTAVVNPSPAITRALSLANGQRFGHFIIVRALGRGGMGEVYEAEDIESGRRVALKRLHQSLGTDVDRARFLREGRLAASINHEHVVYVYGSEEIDGSPVITMELAAGGSLKDRIDAHGPMSAATAVDAILQVIDGLEATANAGVLHRDVKPSNCFVSHDGSIKVGDFGLSIPTEDRAESHLTFGGVVLGTPMFASPEQIMGEALDLRSDIYSTAATLYFLLTGRPPLGGDSVAQVIGSVIKRSPPAPSSVVVGLSLDLDRVVQRGLEKEPTQRYQSYHHLRRALLPHSSQGFPPAPLHARVLASIADQTLYSLPFVVAMPDAFARSNDLLSRQQSANLIVESVAGLIYFGVLEGAWGASLGKWLLGIRVTSGQQPIALPQALLRVSVWIAATILVPFALAVWYERATGTRLGDGRVFMSAVGVALLFVTARRANGFAGVHDLLTGTRVVEQPASPLRVTLQLPPRHQAVDPRAERLGAYLLIETLGATDGGHLVLGYDDVLRRRVWIHVQPPGTPEVTHARRALARPGRLRWLSGRRTQGESWDAYDAPTGVPFMSLVREPQPWSLVRFLLHDMAVESQAIVNDHESVPAALERIWVTQHGRALFLDFVAPGTAMGVRAVDDMPTLITKAAFLALTGGAPVMTCGAVAVIAPLPLHAYDFLMQLERGTMSKLAEIIAALQRLLSKPVTLTRRRRLAHVATVVAVPAAAGAFTLVEMVRQGAFTWPALTVPIAGVLLMMSTASTYTAAFFRGGLWFQLLGIAVATRTGPQASRLLTFWRAVIAWLPSLVFVGGVVFQTPWVAISAIAVIAAGMVSAVLTPDRGLHDRLLGTRLVRQ
jgi:serine/threonine protein kinase